MLFKSWKQKMYNYFERCNKVWEWKATEIKIFLSDIPSGNW